MRAVGRGGRGAGWLQRWKGDRASIRQIHVKPFPDTRETHVFTCCEAAIEALRSVSRDKEGAATAASRAREKNAAFIPCQTSTIGAEAVFRSQILC